MQRRLPTVLNVLGSGADDLARAGSRSARLDAEVLLAHVLGTTRIGLYLAHDRPLSTSEVGEFERLLDRRRGAEPVAYIVGEREFYGWPFFVDRSVLVPRPETELLVEQAHRALGAAPRGPLGRVLDVGTGSGAIGIALGLLAPTAHIDAVDVSAGALDVAAKNAERHGLTSRLRLLRGDLLEPVSAANLYDVVVSNPPYIPTAELEHLMRDVAAFEPHLALDGGTDGLRVIERLVAGAPDRLLAGGALVLEVGADQAPAVRERISRTAAFEPAQVLRDWAGIERIVWAARR